MSRRSLLGAILVLTIASGLPAQSTRPKDLAAGKILVASRQLGDPNFAETVVLLVQYDDKGVVGLVINRRTSVPLSKVLEDFPGARHRSDPIFAGGPVERTTVFGLVDSRERPAGAEAVFGSVYLLTSRNALQRTLASSAKPGQFHVYLGYAGWTRAQLRHELELGAWFIFPGQAGTVFDEQPASLWSRLIEQTGLHIAGLTAH